MASRSNCWRHARNERRMPPAFDGRISTLFAAKQTMQRYLTVRWRTARKHNETV